MSGVRRIIAGVSGSPRNLPALRYAAELARVYEAAFVPVHTWVPPVSEGPDYQFISEYLRPAWEDAARQRLGRALDMAVGGLPPGIPAEPLIVQGNAGPILVGVASQAGDTLVIGTGRRGAVSRLWHGTVSRYCLAHARCPVIAIPPPTLDLAAAQGVRGWALRHKIPSPDDIISGAAHAS
ncbi:MAG TPA: universal stress protein [Streptosporangiaceae bacterium]|jgi:nucleotide-binding universal stress UspA family protein|nr:universal stress protein [Streptosporangiaceae bacterium]